MRNSDEIQVRDLLVLFWVSCLLLSGLSCINDDSSECDMVDGSMTLTKSILLPGDL